MPNKSVETSCSFDVSDSSDAAFAGSTRSRRQLVSSVGRHHHATDNMKAKHIFVGSYSWLLACSFSALHSWDF